MIRLHRRRRSFAIWAALCLAAAALVGVSMPASAAAEDDSIFVYGDYLVHRSEVINCTGPLIGARQTLAA